MDWKNILVNAGYAEEADCVVAALEAANITTLLQLQNSVGRLGHICQTDIYALVAAVNKVFSEGLPVNEVESAESTEFTTELEEFELDLYGEEE